MESTEKVVRIRWKKSAIGKSQRQKATLKGLGFRRLNEVRTLPDRPEIRGMIRVIHDLVEVVEG
jgi:large subunit ribosomal protein L30